MVQNRFKTSWKLLGVRRDEFKRNQNVGGGSTNPRHRNTTYSFNTSSLSKVVFNRIATDAAMVSLNHVKTDPKNDTQDVISGELQDRFSLEANIDQNAYQFFHDLIYSLMDEGVVAVVPIETSGDILDSQGAYEIYSMRTAKILEWFPKHVRIRVYDDFDGEHKDVTVPKTSVAIIENPFYEVLNASNSTLERLKRKMMALDKLDDEIMSGKFNLIFQLPFDTSSPIRKNKAKDKVKELEEQLKDNKYGVAYTGATDKVIQLNRPIDNDLADQVKWLQEEFFNQLGLTVNIFNGTASEAEMNNYYARAIDPIMTAIVQEFRRKFLTRTARTQGQSITYNRDIFKLIPVSVLAEIADKMSRNEILTPNELRNIMGFRSAKDPKANELTNRNIASKNQEETNPVEKTIDSVEENEGGF